MKQEDDLRKILIDFFLFFRENGEKYMGLTIEQLIDKFLEK